MLFCTQSILLFFYQKNVTGHLKRFDNLEEDYNSDEENKNLKIKANNDQN